MIDLLLSRLDSVRQSAGGWRADCPNGHNKARGSLAIMEAKDGRVLLHCFACSDTNGILRVLGMEIADLFPERIGAPRSKASQEASESFKCRAWGAALGVLDREATIVLIAANDIHAGKSLSVNDVTRVGLAAERIALARVLLR